MSWLERIQYGGISWLIGYGVTLVVLVVTLIRRHANSNGLLLAPIVAFPTTLVGSIGVSICAAFLPKLGTSVAGDLTNALVTLLGLGAVAFLAGLLLTRRVGVVTDTHKRGTVLKPLSAREQRQHPNALTLGGFAIPESDETKHFKFLGTTGAGKSTAMRELLQGALRRGDRIVIADPDGGYLARFYDSKRGDVILNPFDDRSAQWDLFTEIRQPYDVEQLARSLIPEGVDPHGQEWRGFARTFLASVLEYCKTEEKTDLSELHRLLVVADQPELQDILAGSAAQPLVAGEGKMFRSVRGTATPVFNILKYIKGVKGEPFSVREWVQHGRGVLFMPYQASQIAALKTLIAAWLRIAIFEAMSQPEGDQRLWFVIDELDALGQIDGLKDALARLRKFGGRCLLGLQSIAQMRGCYGDTDAQTIVENCGTTLILRCSASERGGTAEFASRLIGRREIVRQHVTHSRPDRLGGFLHQTKTVSDYHTTEDAVMPSEIEQLPDLLGYLKLASQAEWQQVRLTPQGLR